MAEDTSKEGTTHYVQCPSCGTSNLASAVSCTRCGKPMVAKEAKGTSKPPAAAPSGQLTCPRCRKSLPAGSRFCGYCGAPLIAAPAASKAAEPPMAPTQPLPALVQGKIPRPGVKPPTPPPPPAPPRPAVARPSAPPVPAPAPGPKVAAPPPPPRPAPVVPPAPPTPAAAPPEGEETQIFAGFRAPRIEASIVELKQDGSSGKVIPVTKEILIGQGECDVSYPSDTLLSPRHASVTVRGEKVILKDLGSRHGTFVKQRQDQEVAPGDVFLIGRQLFRFALETAQPEVGDVEGTQVMLGAPKLHPGPQVAKLERIQLTGEVLETFKLEKPETTLGRTRGDLMFKNDPFMSGEHARIQAQPGRFVLQDLKSRNGIYRRIRGEVELRDRDEFFMGEQIFRVEVKTG